MSINKQSDAKSSNGWNSLETLEHSRYKSGQKSPVVATGSRPTIKTMKTLDVLTSEEDKKISEASLKADNDVKGFLEKFKQEELDIKNTQALKKKVASLNNEEEEENVVNQRQAKIITDEQSRKVAQAQSGQSTVARASSQADRDNEEYDFQRKKHSAIKETFLGFGRLYINKTNSILNPLRFVMENKNVVLKAILLFVIPAFMTYFFTTQISSVQMELAKENMLIKSVYAIIFYFASMFILFTGIIAGSAIINGLLGSIKNAQKVGRD